MEKQCIQTIILEKLGKNDKINSLDLEKQLKMSQQELYAEIISLNALNYIKFQNVKVSKTLLTKQGHQYADQGTPQAKIFNLCTKQGQPKQKIQQLVGPSFKFGFPNAMRKNIIQLKDNKIFKIKEEFIDQDQKFLIMIRNGQLQKVDSAYLKNLKSRKLVQQKISTYYLIEKGTNFKQKKQQVVADLTTAMIIDESWEKTNFKSFNPESKGAEIQNGNLHVLMKTKQQFTEILTQMGFEEMKTDRYVQSSFWNFDSLFQPQAHPARDAHDTFFIKHPQKSKIDDKEYFQKIRNIHQKGGYGSLGYDYKWDPEEAYKNILRTHTTAISSQVLKSISEQKSFKPRKFFSIDRVFRNQTLDNTHLAQFHQVEGFVIDKNLGLNHLIGILTEFYKKIGIQQLWFKPTYNPYTQPSMQIFGLHPILKRKVEIGNSGIFRPQMLRPMGFPEDVSVIAWGLSLQRPTMIQFGISNIKQLFGPGVSLKKVKQSGIYCL